VSITAIVVGNEFAGETADRLAQQYQQSHPDAHFQPAGDNKLIINVAKADASNLITWLSNQREVVWVEPKPTFRIIHPRTGPTTGHRLGDILGQAGLF